MVTAPTYPPAAQLRVLAERIAAKVVPRRHLPGKPQARTDEQHIFAERLIQTVVRVRGIDRRSTGQVVGSLLREAANIARRLEDIYSRMSRRDRDWVEHIKGAQMQFAAGKIQHVEATLSNLSMLLHSALGKAYPISKPPRLRKTPSSRFNLLKGLGMLKPRVKDQMLRELVFGLLHAAQETGGKLDFNKNNESGALAETLRLLRDGNYLPPGLVPDPLRPSTIQRLKTEFSRLA
jgi:hypothetical protein